MPSGNESKDRGDNLLKRGYTRTILNQSDETKHKYMKNRLARQCDIY
jgi:hypothetical protein